MIAGARSSAALVGWSVLNYYLWLHLLKCWHQNKLTTVCVWHLYCLYILPPRFTSNALLCSPGRKHAHPAPARSAACWDIFVACFDFWMSYNLKINSPDAAAWVLKIPSCSPFQLWYIIGLFLAPLPVPPRAGSGSSAPLRPATADCRKA